MISKIASENGRFGVMLRHPGDSPVAGDYGATFFGYAARVVGERDRFALVDLEPAPGTVVVIRMFGAEPLDGASSVLTVGLQGHREIAILNVTEGGTFRVYGYRRRSSTTLTVINGQAREADPFEETAHER